jgi:dinuclear metal center YbgI/SA1388 family protein
MTLSQIDNYFRSFLKIDEYAADISLNGIQIQNNAPQETQITKIAFAVDACEQTALAAYEAGAQLLFVHHGIFWGHETTITRGHYKRIAPFIKNDIALYACHIPLDANETVGNNFGLAFQLGLQQLEKFGTWRGMSIGVKGLLSNPMTPEEICRKLFYGENTITSENTTPSVILPFGKEKCRSVGIISGGAGEDVSQAIDEELDCYITGEIGHENYHVAKEGNINVISAGHYRTETIGVNLVKAKVEKELGLKAVFLDFPTGL